MPRYKITIEYDGTGYVGWQKQPGFRSVQGELIAAIQKFCGEEVDVVGAGRTDAGVHATNQVAHFDISKEQDPFRVMQGINFHLFDPEKIQNRISVTGAAQVDENFHARFSATRRFYTYRIINRRARLGLELGRAWHIGEPLNVDAMQEAANFLLGHHDFTSFRDSACQAKSPIKTLDFIEVKRFGDEIRVSANSRSFLHHQMRIMVGTIALVGKGKWKPIDVKKALEAKNRDAAGITAPPEGLYLVGVSYD